MKTYLSTTLILALFTTACSVLKPVKDTSVFHLLDSAVPARQITANSPSIAISRPSLPSYLDRQQLVNRSGDGQLQMNSYHLWSEPLDSAIARVTATNLARLTNSLNIQPIEAFVTLDYQSLLEIRVSRFEPDASGYLIFECTWKLQPVSGRLANTRSFRTQVPLVPTADTKDLGPRIIAMNEALARLAREVRKVL